MRALLVGLGRWGRNHLKNLVEILGQESVSVFDSDKARMEDAKRAFPGIRFANSSEEKADIAVVATPAETHYTVAKALLEGSGVKKGVLVEKPLALRYREARDLVETARRVGKKIAVGHLMTCHPAVRKVREMAQDGRYGRLRFILSKRISFGKFRKVEDVVWSLGPHDLSIGTFVAGAPPLSVEHIGASLIAGKKDIATIKLTYGPGVVHIITLSWVSIRKEREHLFGFDEAMVSFDEAEPGTLRVVGIRRGEIPEKRWERTIEVDRAEPLRVELEEFIAWVEGRIGEIPFGAEKALEIIRVLEEVSPIET